MNKSIAPKAIIGVVLAAILIGALLSTALTDITGFAAQNVTIDGVTKTVALANPTVSTLVSTVIPIIAVIGLIMLFVPKAKSSE